MRKLSQWFGHRPHPSGSYTSIRTHQGTNSPMQATALAQQAPGTSAEGYCQGHSGPRASVPPCVALRDIWGLFTALDQAGSVRRPVARKQLSSWWVGKGEPWGQCSSPVCESLPSRLAIAGDCHLPPPAPTSHQLQRVLGVSSGAIAPALAKGRTITLRPLVPHPPDPAGTVHFRG